MSVAYHRNDIRQKLLKLESLYFKRIQIVGTNVKIQITLSLLCVMLLAGCKAPPPPITDNTIVSSNVDGVVLSYRHAITPPAQFTPLNQEYRALYASAIMSKPDFGGNVVKNLQNGQTFTVLGLVENNWLAIADSGQKQLIGYIQPRAGVQSDLYDQTLKADRRRPHYRAKKTCVSIDGQGNACRSSKNGTWIIN